MRTPNAQLGEVPQASKWQTLALDVQQPTWAVTQPANDALIVA
jgi:hypothetical protein